MIMFTSEGIDGYTGTCAREISAIVCGGVQYMDRIYVKHNDKAPVHQLGLDLWRDCVVRRRDTRERLLSLLLSNVRKERLGDVIDRALLRSITQARVLGC